MMDLYPLVSFLKVTAQSKNFLFLLYFIVDMNLKMRYNNK